MLPLKRKEKARIAARARRSQEASIIMEMAQELNITQERMRRIDKATIVRLAIDYIKAFEVLCRPCPSCSASNSLCRAAVLTGPSCHPAPCNPTSRQVESVIADPAGFQAARYCMRATLPHPPPAQQPQQQQQQQLLLLQHQQLLQLHQRQLHQSQPQDSRPLPLPLSCRLEDTCRAAAAAAAALSAPYNETTSDEPLETTGMSCQQLEQPNVASADKLALLSEEAVQLGLAPRLSTNSIFAPRTNDMDSHFLMIDETRDGKSAFVFKPDDQILDEDDLTHLAPQAGDVSISLEAESLDGIELDSGLFQLAGFVASPESRPAVPMKMM